MGIRGSGEDLAGYHEHWVRSSGVAPESAVAMHHQSLLPVLHHLVCVDQVDALQLAGTEMLCRRLLQLQRAVKRAPKSPDFRGLEFMSAPRLGSSSTLLVGDFAKFVAEEQKAEAFTMKQQRLFAEESDKRRPGGGGGGGGK